MQKQTVKMKSTWKTGQEEPGLRKSQPWRKVNGQSQRKSTVKSTLSTSLSMMMSADWASDVSRWHGSDDVTWGWHQQVKTWHVQARGKVWRRVERMSFCAESFCGVWQRVESPMMVRFPREGWSAEDDLSGTCKNTIGVMITMATVWQWSRDSEWWWLQVRSQRR